MGWVGGNGQVVVLKLCGEIGGEFVGKKEWTWLLVEVAIVIL